MIEDLAAAALLAAIDLLPDTDYAFLGAERAEADLRGFLWVRRVVDPR